MNNKKDLEKRVSKLEKATLYYNNLVKQEVGIASYKQLPEEISEMTGLDAKRLIDYARAGYAPSLVADTGEVYFKKQEIIKWIKENLFKHNEGKPLPLNIFVYSNNPRKIEGTIPKEIADVEGIAN
ncbi:hypothetical protein CMI39_03245 [Candidatus Pacearchaeota archaeon]|jgi:hypothetical protein|nr:hypothetical protein [Candidatus Pacearchaeota archaeon]|tara:strand:+ start:3695 stop:4072 length:378 start_codon:yes stop_codon:yes gene_type:complete